MSLKSKTPLRSKVRLKSRAALKSNTPLKSKSKFKPSKKNAEWELTRSILKDRFKNDLKIVSCEAKLDNCWINNGLTFAHAEKRRFLNKNTINDVILCCVNCHTIIESYPHKKMYEFVYNIINKRSKKYEKIFINVN